MSVLTDLEQEFEKIKTGVEKKAEAELRTLYADSLLLEARVKTELVLLRQRAANLETSAEKEAELLVIEAKDLLGKVLAWIEALKAKLGM
jgi:hypothetical protein